MPKIFKLGVLTPSSNTALEPLTHAIVSSLPNVSVHFARFKVTEIALGAASSGQFDDSHILAAAELLADAKVDVIGWSGTAAGWLGFDKDALLVERIQAHTGIPATTAVLALNELLSLRAITRLGIVSPYTADVQQCIVDNYRAAGIEVVAETHESISVNHAFAELSPELLRQRMAQVAEASPQAIVTYCTNLRAAQLAASVEQQLGIPLLDTVSTTVWGMLRKIGVPMQQIKEWGQLYGWE